MSVFLAHGKEPEERVTDGTNSPKRTGCRGCVSCGKSILLWGQRDQRGQEDIPGTERHPWAVGPDPASHWE